MLVTTVHAPSEQDLQLAKVWSNRLNCSFVNRSGLSVPKLQAMDKQGEVLVVSEAGVKCFISDQAPVFFHPSTAMIRVKRLVNGENDVLLDAACAAVGDRVLDCTAGLASDSIVFSHAVGFSGEVTAVEYSPLLYWLAKEGLCHYIFDLPSLNEVMRRVAMVRAHHLDYLRSIEDNSVDIVYFDPMFRMPIDQSSSIRPLRYWAHAEPIWIETIAEAKRVARKTIVLKEQRDSAEFARLGFGRVHRTYSNIAYGVIYL